MGLTDDSFNSTGETVVAFETINTRGTPDFGVSVIGATCGVYGQGTVAFRDRRIAPSGTGVFGRGEAQGVYGVTEGVTEGGTPNFRDSPSQGIGVVGVNQWNSPAVLGDNGILGTDFDASQAMGAVLQTRTGVAGITRSGPGMLGVSMSDDVAANPEILSSLQGTEVKDRTNVADAGAAGLSIHGPGVRGISWDNRGGVFESGRDGTSITAQVRLFPATPSTLQTEDTVQPPADRGEAGDLLALQFVDGNRRIRASLWFCIEGVSTMGSAVWVRVV
jgi:hypothetical protein